MTKENKNPNDSFNSERAIFTVNFTYHSTGFTSTRWGSTIINYDGNLTGASELSTTLCHTIKNKNNETLCVSK